MPRLISFGLSTLDSPNKVKSTENEFNFQQEAQDMCDRLSQIIQNQIENECFGHIRFMSLDKFPDQHCIEFLYSSASHTASLALRKAILLCKDEEELVRKLSIDFLPSLNVSAKPFVLQPFSLESQPTDDL